MTSLAVERLRTCGVLIQEQWITIGTLDKLIELECTSFKTGIVSLSSLKLVHKGPDMARTTMG